MIIKLLSAFMVILLSASAQATTICPFLENVTYKNKSWQLESGPITTGWNIAKYPPSVQADAANFIFSYAEWIKISGSNFGVMSCHYKNNKDQEMMLIQVSNIPKSRYWVNAGSVRIPQTAPLPHFICGAATASECY